MTRSSQAASKKGAGLTGFSILSIAAVFVFVDPWPQPQNYYAFADGRTVFGIPNFWNVATNLLFLAPGGLGLWLLRQGDGEQTIPGIFPAYHVLFFGVLTTALGSAWFHLAPGNDTLFWDRLPMTVAFMSLLAIVISEHVSPELGKRLLWPLLAAGAFSVVYWDYTESLNQGDLRLYGLVQFLPMLLIPTVLLMFDSVYDRTGFIWVAFLLYALAKVFEQMDVALYGVGEVLSGHSVKHVCAALAPMVLIYGGTRRRQLRVTPVNEIPE